MRSLLPAILVMAVLGMHHLAGGPDHTASAPPSGHHAPERVVASVDHSHAGVDDSCCSGISLPELPGHDAPAHPPGDTAPADHGAGHDLLHLCLAILIALAALATVPALLGRWRPGAVAGAGAGIRGVATFARPPPPATAVRLAALGVLRL